LKYGHRTGNGLAELEGNAIKFIPNPDGGAGYLGNPIIFHDKLYISYQNSQGKGQLGEFDGEHLKLIPNPDAGFGYVTNTVGGPVMNTVICDDKLYINYTGSNNPYEIGEFDGQTVAVYPLVKKEYIGKYWRPIVYNNKLL